MKWTLCSHLHRLFKKKKKIIEKCHLHNNLERSAHYWQVLVTTLRGAPGLLGRPSSWPRPLSIQRGCSQHPAQVLVSGSSPFKGAHTCQHCIGLVSHRGDMAPGLGRGAHVALPIICVLSAAATVCCYLMADTTCQVTPRMRAHTHIHSLQNTPKCFTVRKLHEGLGKKLLDAYRDSLMIS